MRWVFDPEQRMFRASQALLRLVNSYERPWSQGLPYRAVKGDPFPETSIRNSRYHPEWPSTKRLPNTLNIYIPGISSYDLVNKIGDQVAISSGSACHSGKQIPSRVLKSMGLSDQRALSSIRLSMGKDNTEDEIQKAAEIIISTIHLLRKNVPINCLEGKM